MTVKYLKNFFLFILMTCSLFFFSSKKPAHAETADFVHYIKSTYTIREDSSAFVEYTFTTTNKIASNYLKTFSLNLPFEPKQINVSSSPTQIRVKDSKQIGTKNLYSLELEFPTPVYGINKSYDWRISFEVNNFVLDHAVQTAIIIPTFYDQSSISGFETVVKIPDLFENIRYIYGDGVVSRGDKSNIVTFKNNSIVPPSYMILLGSDQEYFFETLKVNDGSKIHLPTTLPYQEVIYTQFPNRNLTKAESVNPDFVSINTNETIKAFVKTTNGYERNYSNERELISNDEIVKQVLGQINQTNLTKTQLAKRVYDVVCSTYQLNNYITNVDTSVNLSIENKKVNPAELNKIFRESLSSLNIDNRGVYGYVFPVQPFQRNEYVTQEHVWSEFWDGEKWISVDPTWKVSSGGTDYFDKNAFHHVKFGNYHDMKDLDAFFANSGLVSFVPVKYKSNLERKLEIEMSAYNDTYLNKEFRVVLVNKSNQIVKINSIFPSLNLDGVLLKDKKIDINKVIYPQSELNFTIPLEYGLVFRNKEGSVAINVEYEDLNRTWSSKNFSHTITVRSNVSKYLSQMILGVVVLFVFIALSTFTLYKKKI